MLEVIPVDRELCLANVSGCLQGGALSGYTMV